jgi:hypothetical protein
MKRVINFLIGGVMVLGAQWVSAQSAQNVSTNGDDSRMGRDIAVAENVLSTLIKQEFSKRNFFPVEVSGSYRSGYGVTFTIPTDRLSPMIWGGSNDVIIYDGAPGSYSYSFSTTPDTPEPAEVKVLGREAEEIDAKQREKDAKVAKTRADKEMEQARKEKENNVSRARLSKERLQGSRDSLYAATNAKVILAAKNFLADYGDMLSQLKPEEKIIITNRGDNHNFGWYWNQSEKRTILLVEAQKGDLTSFRQGKITRDQLLAKIKVTNTESSGKREPDLEVLSSAFDRLYNRDLSTTYYIESNTYYEKLSDFGAILYLRVVSSTQTHSGLLTMPTINLTEIDQETRDKKVKELYPLFEKELKENILEYGSLVRSLKDNEQLVLNVKLTKCKGCGIPADIEVSVPYSVLKDYSSGKVDKNSALGKMTVKKGVGQ